MEAGLHVLESPGAGPVGEPRGEFLGQSPSKAVDETGTAVVGEQPPVQDLVLRHVREQVHEGLGCPVPRLFQWAQSGAPGDMGDSVLHGIGDQGVQVGVVLVDGGTVDLCAAGHGGHTDRVEFLFGREGEQGGTQSLAGALDAGIIGVHGTQNTTIVV